MRELFAVYCWELVCFHNLVRPLGRAVSGDQDSSSIWSTAIRCTHVTTLCRKLQSFLLCKLVPGKGQARAESGEQRFQFQKFCDTVT